MALMPRAWLRDPYIRKHYKFQHPLLPDACRSRYFSYVRTFESASLSRDGLSGEIGRAEAGRVPCLSRGLRPGATQAIYIYIYIHIRIIIHICYYMHVYTSLSLYLSISLSLYIYICIYLYFSLYI